MFAEGIAVRFEVRKNVMPVRSKECKADPIPPGCESTQAEWQETILKRNKAECFVAYGITRKHQLKSHEIDFALTALYVHVDTCICT
jgi:hypothetical protein